MSGFGKPCPLCGRSEKDHPDMAKNKPVYNKEGLIVGVSRNCDLKLISEDTIVDFNGNIIPYKVNVPDSPYPRTIRDPRRWVHKDNIPRHKE